MADRATLTLTLETVTPLLLGGARGANGPPELRPPAMRGLLRYWFRAAAGGVIGDQNLAGLHRLESAVFGDTTSASPVVLRLGTSSQALEQGPARILPHREGGASRSAFRARQRFQLELHARPGTRPEVWQAACATTALALTCGGLGLRSRRGYGTLRVVASSAPVAVGPFPTTLDGWKQHVETVTLAALTAARTLTEAQGVPRIALPQGPTSFPCANREGLLRLVQVDGATTCQHALVALMRGLPKGVPLGGIGPRQASPLWARPIEVDGQYHLLLTVLASRLAGRTDYPAVREALRRSFRGEDLSVPGWNA